VDESGFMLQPTVRRTWAPKGQTPIHYTWDRRDRLSAISAISVSPRRHQLTLHFSIQDTNVHADDFAQFVSQVLPHFARGLILVIDRWMVHRSAARKLRLRFRRVDLEWLPPYAPDLNPVEQVWNHSKYVDLANFIPEDVHTLGEAVTDTLARQCSQKDLLRSFFHHAQLKI
jgi:transposase